MKVYINSPGHMNKVAAKPIYVKTFKIFFSRTRNPMMLIFVIWDSSSTTFIDIALD